MRLAARTPDPARQDVQPVTAGIEIILTRLSVAGHQNLRLGGAAAAGVKLDRVFGDFSRHTVYYLLEADFVEDVQKFLAPGWLSCTSEVIPVSEEPIGG